LIEINANSAVPHRYVWSRLEAPRQEAKITIHHASRRPRKSDSWFKEESVFSRLGGRTGIRCSLRLADETDLSYAIGSGLGVGAVIYMSLRLAAHRNL
jgi:hypothetical protein